MIWEFISSEILRISEVSSEEYIQLIASWEYLKREKQYGCQEKHQTLQGARLEGFKDRNGCGFRILPTPRQTVGIVNFHSCFCDHLLPEMSHFLWLHKNYAEKGILPCEGFLLDQPNYIMEVFKIIDRFKYEAELEQQKQQQRQIKK